MARPQTRPGELGVINVSRLASGKYQARGATRDDSGALQRLRASGDTEEGARAALERKAACFSTGGGSGLTPDSTIAQGVERWLEQVRARAKAGSLSFSTYEVYETAARMIIVPRFGAVRFEQLTVGRCDRMIQDILQTESISKARRARTVLSLLCGYAVRDDALPRNPVRDVQRLPTSAKKDSVLTTEQISGVRNLMKKWRERRPDGPRPNYRALVDGMDIMLGTSLRIGECLALRRCDVDITSSPPTLVVSGTVVSNKTEGIYRKDSPKRARQRRTIALPSVAAAAVRYRLALADSGGEAFLFPTKTGKAMSVSNYERLLRSFIADERESLMELGVDVDEYTTHIYRRTSATLVERAAGITLASRLLGHANEQITRGSYVVSAEQVDPVTAEILDEVLGA
ncbi:tyrosine-type recombinase/integrase [Agromyces sp. CFH 90414]|uniref:Tyrosine-type recombinase/integrase n=1 Tax=Agromyces agglutinans TaxID=2662258 RepID=A0A6I2F3K9_9MICO|nr:tyrosine-type recombinase/integrase [Agromyces agglutinans]MRG58811.1 tyrosine-type recombinase/integrase [Agromyces agglutinans]